MEHRYFVTSIDQEIPNTVTHLFFDTDYNEELGHIPDSVVYLRFGKRFNQEIKGKIPKSVKTLIFGKAFNRNIKDAIPHSVETLIFGKGFIRDFTGCIPNSVKYLEVGLYHNKKSKIPKWLSEFRVRGNIKEKRCGALMSLIAYGIQDQYLNQ